MNNLGLIATALLCGGYVLGYIISKIITTNKLSEDYVEATNYVICGLIFGYTYKIQQLINKVGEEYYTDSFVKDPVYDSCGIKVFLPKDKYNLDETIKEYEKLEKEGR